MEAFILEVAIFLLLPYARFAGSAITLTPHAQYACAGERIEFTCTATGTSALQWVITVPGHTSENGIISSTQSVSTISTQISSNVFILSRISVTPLTSTLSVISSRPLNGTLIRCSTGNIGTDMAVITTINIGTPSPFLLSVRSHIFGESAIFIHLQWVQSLNRGDTIYLLETEPLVDEALTSDTNVLLYILYNTRYNVTMSARNCEGSTNASIKLYFGKCGYPEVNHDVIIKHYTSPALNGSTVIIQCHPEYVINGPMEIICNSSGDWNPDPRNVECIADCGAPSSNSYVSLFYNSTTAGSRVNYWCKDGLLPNSVLTSECHTNKSWVPNPALLVCTLHRQATCSFPSPPNNGAIANFSDTEEGVRVTFQCNDGFTPIGEVTSMCLANGTWETVNPISLRCTALKRSDTESTKLAISTITCFIFGIFLGMTCLFFYLKCYMRRRKSSNGNNEDSVPPDPMYEEVDVSTRRHITLDLNENISYVSQHIK